MVLPSLSLQEHFLDVMRNQEFLLLPPSDIEKLLASDDMNVPEEETVVQALLSWVRYDCTARQDHLPNLLAHIRLPLLHPQVRQEVEYSIHFSTQNIQGLTHSLIYPAHTINTQPQKLTISCKLNMNTHYMISYLCV